MAANPVTPRVLVLAGLTVAAAVALAVSIWPQRTADTRVSSPQGARGPGVAQEDPAVPPPLGLEGMEAERSTPANRRDLFRFGAAPPAPAETETAEGQTSQPGPGGRRGAPQPPPVQQPDLPPAPAPIPLRFIGLSQTAKGPIATLSDGKFVFNAREGDIVEGRWRVVKIGAESLVIERLDGTGRQTLRGPGGTDW